MVENPKYRVLQSGIQDIILKPNSRHTCKGIINTYITQTHIYLYTLDYNYRE